MYSFCQVAMLMKTYLLRFFKLFAKQILIFLKCEIYLYSPRQKSDFTGLVWHNYCLVNFHFSELLT
jgi:hypothetical protein